MLLLFHALLLLPAQNHLDLHLFDLVRFEVVKVLKVVPSFLKEDGVFKVEVVIILMIFNACLEKDCEHEVGLLPLELPVLKVFDGPPQDVSLIQIQFAEDLSVHLGHGHRLLREIGRREGLVDLRGAKSAGHAVLLTPLRRPDKTRLVKQRFVFQPPSFLLEEGQLFQLDLFLEGEGSAKALSDHVEGFLVIFYTGFVVLLGEVVEYLAVIGDVLAILGQERRPIEYTAALLVTLGIVGPWALFLAMERLVSFAITISVTSLSASGSRPLASVVNIALELVIDL